MTHDVVPLTRHSLVLSIRLAQDRELQLHDGRRLLRYDRYVELQSQLGWSDVQMAEAGIQKIHPSFRMIALAEPPSSGKIELRGWADSVFLVVVSLHIHIRFLCLGFR